MLKMSDTGNHNESSPIETVIPKPSTNHVSLYKLFVKGVSTLQCREYFLDRDR